jgi:hypothetical protein
MNLNRHNRPGYDEPARPSGSGTAPGRAPLDDARAVLAENGLDPGRIFRVYGAEDELAERVWSAVGPVGTDTVVYLDRRRRPRTAVRLLDGTWLSRPGWGAACA